MTSHNISRFGLFVGLLAALTATGWAVWAVAKIWETGPVEANNATAVIFTRHDAIHALTALGDGSLIAVGKYGKILRASDQQLAWEEISSPTTEDLFGVAFRDDRNGIAVGASGTYLVTADGGRTWSGRDMDTTSELLDVVLEADGNGLIIGSFGLLWRTDSGGASWEPIAIPWDKVLSQVWDSVGPVEPHLYAAAMLGSVAWVVGEYGLVLVSTDGGRSFERRRGGQFTDPHLFALDLADSEHGVAAGQAGLIVTTADGGATWAESSRWETDLYGVSIYNGRVVLSGDLGSVLLLPDASEPAEFRVVAAAGRAGGTLGDRWIGGVQHIGQDRFLALGKGPFRTFSLPPQRIGQADLKPGS